MKVLHDNVQVFSVYGFEYYRLGKELTWISQEITYTSGATIQWIVRKNELIGFIDRTGERLVQVKKGCEKDIERIWKLLAEENSEPYEWVDRSNDVNWRDDNMVELLLRGID